MANTADGLMIVGVSEGEGKRPKEIVGIDHKDPEDALRNYLANVAEPSIPVDVQVLRIPAGHADAGRTVVVLRIRRGLNPPYLYRQHGVYIRIGDQDRHASVRELQVLFERRAEIAPQRASGWNTVQGRAFGGLAVRDPSQPPILVVGLTPTFPITPIQLGNEEELAFIDTMRDGLAVAGQPYLETDGFSYMSRAEESGVNVAPLAAACSDGSIALRNSTGFRPSTSEGPREIDVIRTWKQMRRHLAAAVRWPSEVCGVSGPLHYSIAIGNLADVVLNYDAHEHHGPNVMYDGYSPSPVRSALPSWIEQGEWDSTESEDDLIERLVWSLARQLQARFSDSLWPQICGFARAR